VAILALLGVSGASAAASTGNTTPPAVVVVAPVDGAIVRGSIRLDAMASDDVAVTQVKYYVDGVEVAQDNTAPDWSEGWNSASVPDGSHVLEARARDAAGNWGTSAGITFTVANLSSGTDTVAPTLSLTAPQTSALVFGTVLLDVSASDNLGVTLVEYFVDGLQVAADGTAPDWDEYWDSTTVLDGSHVVAARARDAAGNWGWAAGVSVTVANGVVAPPSSSGDPTIAAAGDIAGSGTGDEATALILDRLAPDGVLTLGDNAYSSGTPWEFTTYYEPTWGRHKAKTHPAPGNHDYLTAGASGYFGYFGVAAGDPSKGYYSFDLGQWHLIALNSEIEHGDGSAQLEWLKSDLAAHPATCTLAYWHKPRFSDGADNATLAPFWSVLYGARADVVLSGHEHNYQRLSPLNPEGAVDTGRGIRTFIVGTGGRGLYALVDDPVRQAGNATTHGVLEMTLHPQSYDWRFVAEAGKTYSDSGTATCN
jgi:Bacterial Ig domain/Calcineurin-like phosphoesterase